MKEQYSYLTTLIKGIKYFVIYSLAWIVASLLSDSSLSNLTIVDLIANTVLGKLTLGSVGVMLINWLKVKWGIKIIK